MGSMTFIPNDNIVNNTKENDIYLENDILEKKIISPKRNFHPFRAFWRKTHKWIGLIISFFVLNFAISGVILNHRDWFSSIDLPRSVLPQEYRYMNWNNAAVKSVLPISETENIVFGNTGIWKENSGKFYDFNSGLPEGMDNRNVHSLVKSNSGRYYAGTLTGFYSLNKQVWKKIHLPTEEQRVIKILENNGKIVLLTRSEIILFNDNPIKPKFSVKQIQPTQNYANETGLFQTLWQLHSGEAFWLAGRIFVDFLAIVFILLTVTGIIKWYFPKTFIKLKEKKKKLALRKKINIWSLSLHNQFGLWTSVFLLLTTLTGIFLRPPLLILVGANKVPQLPGTHLSQSNQWYDKLRNIAYLPDEGRYIFATDESVYSVDENFQESPTEYPYQPLISVMGVNVLEAREDGGILVGSFSGLFLWYPNENLIFDYVTKAEYQPMAQVAGPPIGANAVSGYGVMGNGREYYFDYNLGGVPLNSNFFFPKMSKEIESKVGISLWNTALEFHTARIFNSIIGDFYILLIPLTGILIAITIISGVILWFKLYRGKKLIKG
jgi:hypothetical protein